MAIVQYPCFTECKVELNSSQSWTLAGGTQAVGDYIHYSCVHNVHLMVASYKCLQDGSWRMTNYSTQNIQECNRAGIQRTHPFTLLST
jgi:hypothetical protein